MTTRNSYPRSTGFGMPRTSGLTTGHRTIGWMGRFCARLSVCVSTFGLYAGVALAAVPDGIQGDVLDCIVEPSVVVELGAAPLVCSHVSRLTVRTWCKQASWWLNSSPKWNVRR